MKPEIYKPEFVEKGWGGEIVIRNDSRYCGKILQFKEGFEGSGHIHRDKTESWFIHSGEFILTVIDSDTGAKEPIVLKVGDVIHLEPCIFHKVHCVKAGEIFEVSTHHEDSDTYRIEPGDSQKKVIV